MLSNGIFLISLDFELFWGVRDHRTIANYGHNLKAVHNVVPLLLDLFNRYSIRATWATVGILFARNQNELIPFLPELKPSYAHHQLNPYVEFEKQQITPEKEIYYFASQLIDLIKHFPDQEIGSHTFSHYYCLEPGQTTDQFKADLKSAQKIAAQKGLQLKSLVFPRNQFNQDYLAIAKNMGISVFRGNEKFKLYALMSKEKQTRAIRGLRLLDSYFNLTGNNIYDIEIANNGLMNLPASRFLRPYTKRFKFLEPLKIRRITKGLDKAAQHRKIYHLWWHPHNFGSFTNENIKNLETILKHYQSLKNRYGFESLTMGNVYDRYCR